MSNHLRIAIIGCGRAAELIYLPALKKFPDVELTALVDPIKERRELISEKLISAGTLKKKCLLFESPGPELMEGIDAAIICSPPQCHIETASEVLKNNKSVLVEKPLALSMDGVKELQEIQSLSSASLVMAFNHRYWTPINELRKIIPEPEKIRSAEIIYSGNYDNWNPVSFRSNSLNDLGPHVFDLIRYIFNEEILSVSAVSPNENSIDLKVKTLGNVIVHCRIAHSNQTQKVIRLNTDERNYFVNLSSERIFPEPGYKRTILDFQDKVLRKIFNKTSPIKRTFEIQLSNFFNICRNIKSEKSNNHIPGIKDGILNISAISAAQRSIADNGKEIFLEEMISIQPYKHSTIHKY